MKRHPSLRTPIKRVRGFGSAHDGTHHFWVQRLTAVLLAPLLVWLVWSVVSLAGVSHVGFTEWVARPLNAVLLLISLGALFWHSMLGLQVVVEDYVHNAPLKLATLVILKFAHLVLGLAAVYAVLRIGLGA
ncbi:MAG: succinate dehydrogenase, hydrophobic membrane anchor protein [Gammaproteobacteria bacterium]